MVCSSCASASCVRRVPVFNGLSDVEINQIESLVESRPYDKGAFVFREGERSDSLFVLNEGLIKLTQSSRDGKEHILRFLFPGDYFGQFALLQNKQNYVNAEIIESSTVCLIHRKDFIPLLEKNTTLAYNFLLSMSEQLHHAEDWAAALHMLEVDKRLAKILLYFHSKDILNSKVNLPASKKEIAAMIGTTAETLSRKLNQFEELNLIKVSRRVIHILELDDLQHLAGTNRS
ncbi:Crp/Fnr family transcriptional regulator [Paenibacillus wynnii]|uniref:Crp/Fnr family transcriptional regulator n=1 Tax=Paenibacillus wynnii TaxID=268407 RepID=UPI00278F3AC4|nr:Crp/Fnr family transcriptional regulator [Paenibacillus wynnii]MDQ0195973.1 CRP/FNR family transcriptional regulator [Paenibacillus wynnii]